MFYGLADADNFDKFSGTFDSYEFKRNQTLRVRLEWTRRESNSEPKTASLVLYHLTTSPRLYFRIVIFKSI